MLLPLLLALAVGADPLPLEKGIYPFPDQSLTFDFGTLEDFEAIPISASDQLKARWTGSVGASDVAISYWVLPFEFHDPADVVHVVESDRDGKRSKDGEEKRFFFTEMKPLAGPFGILDYAWLGFALEFEETKPVSSFQCFGTTLEEGGYCLEIVAKPPLDEAGRRAIETFLKEGVSYGGAKIDPRWSEEETEAYWKEHAPDKVVEQSKLTVVRTEYYLILTNLGKGTAKGFGKKIDEAHEEIRGVFPFESIKEYRLLPIFYFTTPDQYHEWYVKYFDGVTLEEARRSGGVSTGILYATYHQATNSPTHIHEATHQIFRNRLRLSGGGSWFQEGVAEYMSTTTSDLAPLKALAKRGKHVPLSEFVTIKSLLYSSEKDRKTGGSEAADHYAQAAGVIEFLRHGSFGKDRFEEYIARMGRVPRGDREQIEKTLGEVYGITLERFDEEFVKYWTKRKKPKRK